MVGPASVFFIFLHEMPVKILPPSNIHYVHTLETRRTLESLVYVPLSELLLFFSSFLVQTDCSLKSCILHMLDAKSGL